MDAASLCGPCEGQEIGQRRGANLRLMLEQLIETVFAGGYGDHGQGVGARRLDVAWGVAHDTDAGNVSDFNNLVHATRIEVARAGSPALILTARVPQNIEDWAVAFKEVFRGIGVADNEVLFFVDRLFTLLTSCPERRIAEYEQIPWWTFIDAATHSAAFQTLLGKGLTRSLVAVRAQEGSTRTVGYILLQLLFGLLTSGGFDRLLNGPTTEVWLTAWVEYLQQRGADLQTGAIIRSFRADASGITGVSIEQ